MEAQTGFRPAPPQFVPDRYLLHRRYVQPTTGSHPDTAPPEDGRLRPNTVIFEYRFLGSIHVPTLVVIQSVLPDAERITLEYEAPDCGETFVIDGRTFFYGLGGGGPVAEEDSTAYTVCITHSAKLAAHAVYFVHQNILVEVKAFPEGGITKEDALRIASSIRFDDGS